jgi:hypothetical protein
MLSLVAMRSRSCHWLRNEVLVLSLRLDRGDSLVRLPHMAKIKIAGMSGRVREQKMRGEGRKRTEWLRRQRIQRENGIGREINNKRERRHVERSSIKAEQ